MNAITFLCAVGISLVITASIIGYVDHSNSFNVVKSQNDVREAVQNGDTTYLDNKLENNQEKTIFTNLEIELIKKNDYGI